jgi:hypothetical protein
MTRLVWMVLNDGRSVIAGCGSETRESLKRALGQPEKTLTFTSDDAVEHIDGSSVRGFIIFDSKSAIPPSATIYRLVHV